MTFTFNWQLGAGTTLTAAHFHGPATATQSAPVVTPITGPIASNTGTYNGAVVLTAGQEADLLAGRWYVNLHSTVNGGGELRGQLVENSTGPNGPVYSSASGVLSVPATMVPALGVYDVQMQLAPGSNPTQFSLTGAVKVR